MSEYRDELAWKGGAIDMDDYPDETDTARSADAVEQAAREYENTQRASHGQAQVYKWQYAAADFMAGAAWRAQQPSGQEATEIGAAAAVRSYEARWHDTNPDAALPDIHAQVALKDGYRQGEQRTVAAIVAWLREYGQRRVVPNEWFDAADAIERGDWRSAGEGKDGD